MSSSSTTGRVPLHVTFLCGSFVALVTLVFIYAPDWQNSMGQQQVEVSPYIADGYVRDHRGYIYPKEYFHTMPKDQPRQFHNMSMIGRHSDTVLPKCQHSKGNDPYFIKDKYKMTEPFKYLREYKNPCWWEGGKVDQTLLCIPYFYFIGTVKAGSTDLFWRIEMHPHVALVSVKEKRWFDTERFIDDRKNNFRFYVNQFDKAANQIRKQTRDTGYHHHIVGDGSPTYMFGNRNWPSLPGNEWCLEPRIMTLSYIHHLRPTAKLIIIVRNPVSRLYSDYLFNARKSKANCTPEQFHDWAKTSIRLYEDCCKVHPFRYCLYSQETRRALKITSFTASIYSRLLLDALRIFPRDQLLVLQMEDYSTNMVQRLEDVFEFLGLDRLSHAAMDKIVKTKQYNKGAKYKKAGPMLAETRRMIYNFYKPFNEELAQILNDKKYLWVEE